MAYTVDEFAQKIKTKYPQYQNIDNAELSKKIVAKYPEYSNQVNFTMQDSANDNSMTPQQKADQIQKMGEAERAGYDKDLNAYKLKATAGAGLAIGGQALDFIPFVGPTLGGAAYGAGMGMINNGSGKDIAKDAVINGAIAGAGAKVIPMIAKSPVGKFVGEKIGQPVADVASPILGKINQSIENKFGVNVGEELAKPIFAKKAPVISPKVDLAEAPTVGVSPIRQTSPNSFAIEVDKTLPGKQSQFAQTVKGSNLATEDLKSGINDVGYQAITNKGTLENAQKTIDKGQVGAIKQVLTSDKPNANEIAMAHDLVRRLQQQGDIETAVKIVEDTSRKLTKAGQTIQAAKIWQQLTPDGALLAYQRAINENIPEYVKPILDNVKSLTKQLYGAKTPKEVENILREKLRGLAPTSRQKIVNQINKARNEGILDVDILTDSIKKHYNIKSINQVDIDEINALTSQIAQAQTEREKEVAVALLRRKISEVKPTSMGRKISTIQAMAQLLNPKTIARNILGNTMYGGIENTTQSLVASPLDKMLSRLTGERTILPNNLKTQYQGFLNGAKMGAEDVHLGIDTAQNKYDLPSGRTFRGGVGEKAEKLMNYTLRVPDRAAYQAVYDEALQNQMKARGLTEPTEDIINQAKEEALKRTFQDDSALSKLFQAGKKGLNFGKDFGLGDFVLKYAKTPANILSRGLSYSPVGLVKGVGELTIPSINKSMPFNQRKAVMDISRGLVGTGILGTGYGLAKSGLVSGQRDKNARINANLMAMGKRPYSVRIGDKNYSYDWAVPISMPFSAGVNYDNGANFVGSLASSADTLTEQPLLQGVKKLSGGGYKTIPEGLVDIAADSLNSFYPSILRQTAQTIDPYYRETRNNNIFKQSLNRTIANTPILSQKLPKKYEVTGQLIKREGGAIQAFLNPANVSSVKNNIGLSEAVRLENPYVSVGKSIKIGKETKKLTTKEISDYQKLVGTATDKYVNDFVNSDEYQYLSDEERANRISKLEKDINKAVKHKLFGTEPLLGKKQRTKEQIINSRLSKYNRVKNLIQKSEINDFINEEQ